MRVNLFLYGLMFIIFVALICMIAFIIIYRMKISIEKKAVESASEINHITNKIHAGFVHFNLHDNFEIIYATKGFYDIIGYSQEVIKQEYNNSIISFVLLDDYKKFLQLNSQFQAGEYIQIEIRMINKNKNIIWILLDGNYVIDKNGNGTVSAVLVDITESKQMQEKLLLEEERYRIAAEISNDILFEYNITDDMMQFANKYEDLYGRETVIPEFSKRYLQKEGIIHPEDIGVFSEYCRALKSGKEMVESEFRICNSKQEYIWCHLRGKTIYNDNKQPIRVLGKLVNIDLHKKELEILESKAKRDPLTGVYNKTATKDLIEHYIQMHQNAKHIFMIIDIDDFKKINDHFGHLQGDKILTYIINQVKLMFSAEEIIGRIGGDEFVVFIGNINNIDAVTTKAGLLQDTLHTVYYDEEYEISVSGSIGISMYPDDGMSYNQLLNCADKALYTVKEEGKNGYKLFT